MVKSKFFAAFAFFFCIAMFSLQPVARAQSNPDDYYEEVPRTFYGGLILGANFTQVDGDNYAGYHKVGLNAGGIVYAQLADHLAASMEILYSQKGSHSSGSPLQTNTGKYLIDKYNITLNYAEIPIQLNYFDKRKSHFGAGFSISRLISSTETVKVVTGGTPVSATDDPATYPFRKFDFNFIVGGSLHLVKGLFLQGRFQYSLVSIRKPTPPEFARIDNQFNNMWTLRFMYLFK